MSQTQKLITGMIVAAVLVVVSIVGYFEWRRASDARAAYEASPAGQAEKTGRDRQKYLADLPEQLARALLLDLDDPAGTMYASKLNEAIMSLQIPPGDRSAQRAEWRRQAVARFKEKHPGQTPNPDASEARWKAQYPDLAKYMERG